jgi:hypothetical protein
MQWKLCLSARKSRIYDANIWIIVDYLDTLNLANQCYLISETLARAQIGNSNEGIPNYKLLYYKNMYLLLQHFK